MLHKFYTKWKIAVIKINYKISLKLAKYFSSMACAFEEDDFHRVFLNIYIENMWVHERSTNWPQWHNLNNFSQRPSWYCYMQNTKAVSYLVINLSYVIQFKSLPPPPINSWTKEMIKVLSSRNFKVTVTL